MNCPKWKLKYEYVRKLLKETLLSNMKFREQNEKMRKALERMLRLRDAQIQSKVVPGEPESETVSLAIESLTPSKGQN